MSKETLKIKLQSKQSRVNLRYSYYEMKNRVTLLSSIIPFELRKYDTVLGWCGKAVDCLADRLCFSEFLNDNLNINEIFDMNNKDIFGDNAILSALISSCCFVYISADAAGFPRLQVINGANATGTIEPITGLLKEGYAVLDKDTSGNPILEAYFLPYKTEYYTKNKKTGEYNHGVPYPLLVPIIYKPDAKRPFGHSRITRACISIMKSAVRTLLRADVSAEFYSFPQKYVTGLSPKAEQLEKWKATISSFLSFDTDEKGNAPKLGQFQQQSMAPYIEHLKMIASLFAGETGLTMDDLGFGTENPSSAEAIKASHENLRLLARKAQRNFGSGFLNVGYLAACVRDKQDYNRSALYKTKALWEPIFEPDSAMLGRLGDGIYKINEAIPGYFDKHSFRQLTGIPYSESNASLINLKEFALDDLDSLIVGGEN